MVNVEASVVTSLSTMTSIEIILVVGVSAGVVCFAVSISLFSVFAWAVVGGSTSLVTFSVASFVCTGETVLSVSFSVPAAVEVSLTKVAVVGFAVLETFIFTLALVRDSVKTASVNLAAVVAGVSVVFSVVTSTAAFVLPASLAADIVNFSVVCSSGTAVVRGVVFSNADSVDSPILAAVVALKAFVFTSVSTINSIGTVVIISVGAAVVTFVVSGTCFFVIPWAVTGTSTSAISFSVTSVVCTEKTVLFVSFSVRAAVEVSSAMILLVELSALGTSTFVMTSVRGFVKTV